MDLPLIGITGKFVRSDGSPIVDGWIEHRTSRPISFPNQRVNTTARLDLAEDGSIPLTEAGVSTLQLVATDVGFPSNFHHIVTIHCTLPSGEKYHWTERWQLASTPSTIAIGDVLRINEAAGTVYGPDAQTLAARDEAVAAAAAVAAGAAALAGATPEDGCVLFGEAGSFVNRPVVPRVELTLPLSGTNLEVAIAALTSRALFPVVGYLIKVDDATAPGRDDVAWVADPPASILFPGSGTYTVYAWVKDSVGQVSAYSAAGITLEIQQVGADIALARAIALSVSLGARSRTSTGLKVQLPSGDPGSYGDAYISTFATGDYVAAPSLFPVVDQRAVFDRWLAGVGLWPGAAYGVPLYLEMTDVLGYWGGHNTLGNGPQFSNGAYLARWLARLDDLGDATVYAASITDVKEALDLIPREPGTGLLYSPPEAWIGDWDWQDSAQATGGMAMGSAMVAHAYDELRRIAVKYADQVVELACIAARDALLAGLATLRRPDGFYNASNVSDLSPHVFATALVVTAELCPPEDQAASATALRDAYLAGTIALNGWVRHLVAPAKWASAPGGADEYHNGAFWGGEWARRVADAIDVVDSVRAQAMREEFAAEIVRQESVDAMAAWEALFPNGTRDRGGRQTYSGFGMEGLAYAPALPPPATFLAPGAIPGVVWDGFDVDNLSAYDVRSDGGVWAVVDGRLVLTGSTGHAHVLVGPDVDDVTLRAKARRVLSGGDVTNIALNVRMTNGGADGIHIEVGSNSVIVYDVAGGAYTQRGSYSTNTDVTADSVFTIRVVGNVVSIVATYDVDGLAPETQVFPDTIVETAGAGKAGVGAGSSGPDGPTITFDEIAVLHDATLPLPVQPGFVVECWPDADARSAMGHHSGTAYVASLPWGVVHLRSGVDGSIVAEDPPCLVHALNY